MRAIFSLLGIVIVLAVISLLVKTQLRPAPVAPVQATGDGLPQAPVVTPGNARQVQEQVRQDLNKALEQASSRQMPE